MALQDPQAEPSMEEILASIRRIISEDEAAPDAAPVLELSTPAAAAPAAAVADDDLLVFDGPAEPEPAAPAVMAEPERPAPRPAPAPTPAPMESLAAEHIMSEPVANQAAGSFTRLAGTLRLTDTHGQTVEGVVRELLQPMLREWLERNLPPIVEAKVEAELDRISRLAR